MILSRHFNIIIIIDVIIIIVGILLFKKNHCWTIFFTLDKFIDTRGVVCIWIFIWNMNLPVPAAAAS